MFKRAIWMTLLTLIVLIAATFLGLLLLKHAGGSMHLHVFLQHYWWAFAIWRYTILAVLLWKWPKLCQWYGRRKGLDVQVTNRIAKGRWWLLAFIVVFEIVVVYGV